MNDMACHERSPYVNTTRENHEDMKPGFCLATCTLILSQKNVHELNKTYASHAPTVPQPCPPPLTSPCGSVTNNERSQHKPRTSFGSWFERFNPQGMTKYLFERTQYTRWCIAALLYRATTEKARSSGEPRDDYKVTYKPNTSRLSLKAWYELGIEARWP